MAGVASGALSDSSRISGWRNTRIARQRVAASLLVHHDARGKHRLGAKMTLVNIAHMAHKRI